MGQKVNPHGLRVGVIQDWDSRWFAGKSTFGDTLVEDVKVRKFIKKELKDAGIPKIEIERFGEDVKIHIFCAKPGILIGHGGENINNLRTKVAKIMNKPEKAVFLNYVEVSNPDIDAQLVAENIAAQLENRASFRRTMKQAIGRAMKLGAKGIKVRVSGRLAGAEIARSETYHEGTIPLQTIRADIDYGFAEAATTYGRLGVKVWIYKGEILKGEAKSTNRQQKSERSDRPDRKRRAGGRDDRNGGRRRNDRAPRGERSDNKREGGNN